MDAGLGSSEDFIRLVTIENIESDVEVFASNLFERLMEIGLRDSNSRINRAAYRCVLKRSGTSLAADLEVYQRNLQSGSLTFSNLVAWTAYLVRHLDESENAVRLHEKLSIELAAKFPKYKYSSTLLTWLHPVRNKTRFEDYCNVWDKQVVTFPTDPQVLANAASFFSLFDVPKATSLLEGCVKLAPNDSRWAFQLAMLPRQNPLDASTEQTAEMISKGSHNGHSDVLDMVLASDAEVAELYRKLVVVVVKADTLPVIRRTDACKELLHVCRQAGDFLDVAYGVHVAHNMLGLFELLNDRHENAIQHLLLSVRPMGSKCLNYFSPRGPATRLVKALHNRGFKNEAIDYFQECKFIARKNLALSTVIDEWIDALLRGRPNQVKDNEY